jgi:hypothetical protein
VAHALTTHLGQGDFNATFLTDNATVLQALVLATQTLVVLDGPKDPGTEEAVTLRLEGAVIDGFGFLDLTMGPGTNQIRWCQPNPDFVELRDLSLTFQHIQQVFQGQSSAFASTFFMELSVFTCDCTQILPKQRQLIPFVLNFFMTTAITSQSWR